MGSTEMTALLEEPPNREVQRTGTKWTAVAHIVTGVIGSGVLSLAWSIAQLGWIGGPLAILVFAAITLLSAFLLSQAYLSPDPEEGPDRHASYREAVERHLGKFYGLLCSFFVNISLFGFGIAFVVTSAISMKEIQKSLCYQEACSFGDTFYMMLFGVIQIVLSQIPNLHEINWLSKLAAIMSFVYSFIGIGLALAKISETGIDKGSIGGNSTFSGTEKVWLVAQAVGDIVFAYPFSIILIEIQDTLRSPPPEIQTIKKASTIAVAITTFFYLCCGISGYAAFGEDTPGNLLTGFGSSKHKWIVNIAHTCIVVHLLGAYQVYSQPLYADFENYLTSRFPESEFVTRTYALQLPLLPAFGLNLLRLILRTLYVAFTVCLAIVVPYFNQILGLLGGINFWPLTILLPVEMYLKINRIEAWTAMWVMFQTFSILCFFVGSFAFAGSIAGIISAAKST